MRTQSKPDVNQNSQMLHPVYYRKYKLGIPLKLYPKSLKSLKSLKYGTECSQTRSGPASTLPCSSALRDPPNWQGLCCHRTNLLKNSAPRGEVFRDPPSTLGYLATRPSSGPILTLPRASK